MLAADWNVFVNNFIAMAPDAFTADGEIYIASAANVGTTLAAFTSSTGDLKRTAGGLEIDTSVSAAGDTLVAQDGTVWGLETAMTQVQAEAGTETQVRGVTAERVKQAVVALSSVRTTITTATRTAAAATGDVGYTGAGFAPKGVIVIARGTDNSDNISIGFGDDADVGGTLEIDTMNGTHGMDISGRLIRVNSGGNSQAAALSSLDADGATLTWTKGGSGEASEFTFLWLG